MADRTGARATREAMTFRVFVSSTFQDLVAERNALQADVWPKLQALCFRHGARFQAVDLRWGVSEEAAQAQQTMRLCLDEIARCQQVTPRPNFIVLLGQRYGWRPPPDTIPGDEFEAITAHLAPGGRALLDHWYARDDNAVPPEYCLLPRRDVAYEDWAGIEADLHTALLAGARAAGLDEEAMIKYERSATEQEIIEGALKADPRNAFSYVREIAGLPEDEGAADFLDLADGAPDSEAQRLMADLKRRLEAHLPEDQRREIPATWTAEGPSEAHLDSLCELVYEDLEGVILAQIAAAEAVDPLDHEIAQHERFAEDRKRHFVGREEMIARIVDYVRQAGGHPLVVHGRSGSGKSALMARVLEELPGDATVMVRFIGATPASTGLHFLLQSLCEQMHREFGLGVLEEQWEPPRSEGECRSSEPLQNTCQILGDTKHSTRDCARLLGCVPEDRKLVILLDALDQLSPADGAHALNWLPRELPPNVRVVVSVLAREDAAGQCFRVAQHRLPEKALVALPELTSQVCEEALDRWLTEQGASGDRAGAVRPRRLTDEQRSHLGENLRACEEGRALYVRLAFEEARLWRSFEPLPTGANDVPGLSPTVEGIIADMLARLESPVNHGEVLTKAALGYMAAARNGLADGEMLDVLSADEEVMADFRERHRRSPLAEQLPPVIWSRLYFDLRPYLVARAADGTSLLGFYHRPVEEVSTSRYLPGPRKTSAHRGLARHFLRQSHAIEELNGRPGLDLRRFAELPYQLTMGEMWVELEKTLTDLLFIQAKSQAGMAHDLMEDYDRVIAGRSRPSPTIITACRHEGRLGLFCPHCLAWSPIDAEGRGSVIPCPQCGTHLCLNPFTIERPWVHSRASRAPQFPSAPPVAPASQRLDDYAAFVRARVHILRTQPEELLQEALNAPSGSAPERDAVALMRPGRVYLIRQDQSRNRRPLLVLNGHAARVHDCAWAPDGTIIVSASLDRTIRIWDAQTGRCHSVLGWEGRANRCEWYQRSHLPTPWDDLYHTGEAVDDPQLYRQSMNQCAISPDSMRVLARRGDGSVREWEHATSKVVLAGLDQSGRVRAMCYSPDGQHIATVNSEGILDLWDSATGMNVWSVAVCGEAGRGRGRQHSAATACAFSPDGFTIATGGVDMCIRLWDVAQGAPEFEMEAHLGRSSYTNAISGLSFSPDGQRLLSASDDHTCRVWSAGTGEELGCLLAKRGPVLSCCWAPNGSRIATGHVGRAIYIWDAQTFERVALIDAVSGAVEGCCYSPDGTRIATAECEGKVVHIWEAP